jgi:hypothetical protein
VIRNVPIGQDMNSFIQEMKESYPDVIEARRIMNKNQQPTTFVRVDISNVKIIDELLEKKYIYLNYSRYSVTEYLAPAKVLACTKCFQIGHFRSSCKSELEFCRICGIGLKDIKQHKDTCNKQQCCIRCQGPHDSNDAKCPEIKSYRAILTKSILTSSNEPIQQQKRQRGVQENFLHKESEFPVLNTYINRSNAQSLQSINTSKRLDDLAANVRQLDENVNRLIELNSSYCGQLNNIQQLMMKHENLLQLHQFDITFQHGLLSQFVFPMCQVMVEIIPKLIQQNVIDNKTSSGSSLSSLCEKVSNDLSKWTNAHLTNESQKVKLINDLNSNLNGSVIRNDTNNPDIHNEQII